MDNLKIQQNQWGEEIIQTRSGDINIGKKTELGRKYSYIFFGPTERVVSSEFSEGEIIVYEEDVDKVRSIINSQITRDNLEGNELQKAIIDGIFGNRIQIVGCDIPGMNIAEA